MKPADDMGPLVAPLAAVQRSVVHQVGALALRLPTPEDLVILKAVAHRPKDLLDVQAILEIHPGLDRERIAHWVREFARALEMPELWDDLAAMLTECPLD